MVSFSCDVFVQFDFSIKQPYKKVRKHSHLFYFLEEFVNNCCSIFFKSLVELTSETMGAWDFSCKQAFLITNSFSTCYWIVLIFFFTLDQFWQFVFSEEVAHFVQVIQFVAIQLHIVLSLIILLIFVKLIVTSQFLFLILGI